MNNNKPQLLFVHGIGPLRDTDDENHDWLHALCEGAAAAGHRSVSTQLTAGQLADVRFANYSDLFNPKGAQGPDGVELADADAPFLAEILGAMLNERDTAKNEDPGTTEALEEARFFLQAATQDRTEGWQSQGAGEPVRLLVGAATALLQVPGLQKMGVRLSGTALLGQLAQVGRYLNRSNVEAVRLGANVRARMLEGLDAHRPLVVVAHSLGTVVAYEALHQYPGPVSLWMTLGSPLALGGVVLPRLVPHPGQCPPGVHRWLNRWDRDDIVVGRPELKKWFQPNPAGVAPETRRVDSDGVWVHTATKYLGHAQVAGPVMEALQV